MLFTPVLVNSVFLWSYRAALPRWGFPLVFLAFEVALNLLIIFLAFVVAITFLLTHSFTHIPYEVKSLTQLVNCILSV
jgi:hypothetical protein